MQSLVQMLYAVLVQYVLLIAAIERINGLFNVALENLDCQLINLQYPMAMIELQ